MHDESESILTRKLGCRAAAYLHISLDACQAAAYLHISCSITSMLLPRVSGTLTLAYQQPRRATEPNRVHTAARPMSSTPRANSWHTTCSRQNQGGR